ncbi:hypothetical protein Tco_1179823 [Tanacetum coccineum]
MALSGIDLEPTHDEFMADLYLKVQESLKFPANEHVILEDLLSSSGTRSSMKNLEDAYAIGDQFINDKSTDDEPGKLNVEAEVVSMVTVLIYQVSSSVPPLSTLVIDLSPPIPASSTTQEPIFTTKTSTTTTTRPLPPLPQQQSIIDSELATRNLGSRVFTLELRDLPHKIDEAVRENVKEAVQIALQAPLRERFKDLPEADMKEMLHQRMFEAGSYKSLPEHIAFYEALEPTAPQSSVWKMSETRDASLSSSKQQSGPHSEQPVEDIQMPDTTNQPLQNLHGVKPTSSSYAENNWANALASTYQAPTKNSLLEKTRDMRTFKNWYYQKVGKTELTQADFEGQAYEVVKAFYPDVVHLQF